MGLMDTAQAAIKRITSDPAGFARSLSFVSPDGLQAATIYGLHTKIHLSIDTEGSFVNSKKAHVSFSESALNDQGYVTRNSNGLCDMKDHKVSVVDSTGVTYQYIIREVFPDESVGLLVCLIGDFS